LRFAPATHIPYRGNPPTLLALPDMYAAIFAAGALGYGLNLLFQLIERTFVHWSGK
jgi:ABC-type nitrate/sulfonate/bicarbonate transport system permease component